MQSSVYQFAVDNVKAHIRSQANQKDVLQGNQAMNVFEAMHVLSVAFMKPQDEVMRDLLAE